jgi:hypothetical protein
MITIEELKRQLFIELDYTDEDSYLKSLIEVAVESVATYLNLSISTLYTDVTLPKAIKHGMLLVASNLYENRTPVAFAKAYEIPLGFKFLLDPYRNYVVL